MNKYFPVNSITAGEAKYPADTGKSFARVRSCCPDKNLAVMVHLAPVIQMDELYNP